MINERRSLGLLLLLAGSAACNEAEPGGDVDQRIAGQTGDEGAWEPSRPAGDTDCGLRAAKAVALEEVTEIGASAADILGFAGGSHEARVHWNARPVLFDFVDFAVQVTPGDLDETLRLTLEHDGSPPRYRASFGLGLDAAPAYCHDQLELDVVVELRSQSGALDERWLGLLTASDASEAVVVLQAPTWRGRLPRQPERDEGHFVNALEGSLDAVDANDPGSRLAWVDLMLRIRTDAIDGSVNGWIRHSDGGAFVMPHQSDHRDTAGWLGVIGDGFYTDVWAIK
jgi:hypothetical protein